MNAKSFTYGYAGVGLHRQFGRSLRGFVSYQFNDLAFDTSCPLVTTQDHGYGRLQQPIAAASGIDWTGLDSPADPA